MIPEDDWLMISGLQHFLFCKRQWALIHIENQWAENSRTADGAIMHTKAHSGTSESRPNLLICRAMRIHSATLGVSGECDAVEYRSSADGVPLRGREGMYLPYPVEYKRGHGKVDDCDRAQLCLQAMCLEEMHGCEVPEGALYYWETRHRETVSFTEELRGNVKTAVAEMHMLYARGTTPHVRTGRHCGACSLKEICLPVLMKNKPVIEYLNGALCESC